MQVHTLADLPPAGRPSVRRDASPPSDAAVHRRLGGASLQEGPADDRGALSGVPDFRRRSVLLE